MESYREYHHLLGHNIGWMFGVMILSGRWVGWRWGSMLRVGVSFVLHVVGDFFGSGPGWGIYPWYPWSETMFIFPHAWRLNAWPNITVTVIAGIYLIRMGSIRGYTPLEFVNQRLEGHLVDRLHDLDKVRPR